MSDVSVIVGWLIWMAFWTWLDLRGVWPKRCRADPQSPTGEGS